MLFKPLHPHLLQRLPALILLYGLYQSPGLAARFENLSAEQGLSQNTIFAIAQDHSGFLWFATDAGLNRYDGVQFVIYSDRQKIGENIIPVLSNKTIYSITVDDKNNLWIGTGQGLNYLNPRTQENKYYLHDAGNPNSLSNDTVRATLLDGRGHLWIATGDGLSQLNLKTDRITRHQPDPENRNCTQSMRTLLQDQNGLLWMGGNGNRLCLHDPQKNTFTTLDYRNDPLAAENTGIRNLFADSEGDIWIASTNGLFRYNSATRKFNSYFNDPKNANSLVNNWVQKIVEDHEHYIWIVTTNGISRLNKKTNQFENFTYAKSSNAGPHSVAYFSALVDQSGLIWFGSSGVGLDIFNPSQTSFGLLSDIGKPDHVLTNSVIWGIVKHHGYIWIATGLGLNRYDLRTGKVHSYINNPADPASLPNNQINAIIEGDNHYLWLATQRGLSRFDFNTEKFENFFHNPNDPTSIPSNAIIHLERDGKNRLWLSLYQEGVSVFDTTQKKVVLQFRNDPHNSNSINSNSVYSVYSDAENNRMWIAALNGMDFYDTTTQTLHHYKKADAKGKLAEVQIVRKINDNRLLIGTAHGLTVHNLKTLRTEHFSKKDGLADDRIYAVEYDNTGNAWISSNRGISRINLAARKITNFDVTDGLQGLEFNSMANHYDGTHLFFGGHNGLNYFIPENVKLPQFNPPVVITNFKIYNQPIKSRRFDQPFKLDFTENFFSIEFAVLDFTSPKKNEYAYMLEGVDKNWIYSGNRNYASYTNIDGGEYRFLVKGSNKYGIWSETPASLKINIGLPPWQRWWAYLGYFLGMGLIIFLIVRYKSLSDSRALADKIRRMTTEITQTLDLDMILFQLAQHLQKILPYSRILIFLKQAGKYEKELDLCHENKALFPLPQKVRSHILQNVDTLRRPIFLISSADYQSQDLSPAQLKHNNIITLPLITRKNIVGAIILIGNKQQNFRDDNLNIAVTLSAHASAAIDNARLFEEAKQLAFYDTLTGLENRRLFKERLEYALKSLERKKSDLALLFLDIDQFKQVNDTLGHEAGDLLLIEISKRLTSCIRAQDTVARIGGDEFTMLLNDVNDIKGASIIADKVLKVFEKPIIIDGQPISTSASIGISLAPKDSLDANTLMKNADLAMYKAKESGRNNYQFFTAEMNTQVTEHLTIKRELRQALEQNQFELYYQPIYDLQTSCINSVEGLIRWIHPQKGLIMPNHFIPYAEETHLIKDIGRWVLHEACRHIQYLKDKGLPNIVFSLNLSVNQIIYDAALTENISETLTKFQINPSQIRMEITESILINSLGKTIKTLNRLRELGITLAIDDFGTGYSSLSYLKQLPIDLIKVDRSFVSGIPNDIEDTEITSAILAMAHKLKLKVVAEGVETQAQRNFLENNGCDFAQGNFFSKPVKLDQLIELMQTPTN